MSEKKSVLLEASTKMASLSDSDVSSISVNVPSNVQVTALSDGLYHIKWAFDISSIGNARGSQETTFKLDQYSSAFYKLTLKFYKQDPDPDQCECSPDTQFMMNLKLKPEACPTSQWLISMDGRDQSAAVWARVGRCQKIILDQLPYIVWKSETFPVIPDWDATEIPCQFWIKFYQSVGEINAIHEEVGQFTNLYVNQLNCDVTFSFHEINEDEPIGGHVIVLLARSSVFAAMFYDRMQETSTRKVCIKDIKPDIFKQLLHYIYSGRTSTKLSEENAQPLFVAADMYDIEDLKDECVQFLLTCIKLENAINLMAWAHVHAVDSLKEAALAFVASHGKEICKQDDWERLIKSYPDLCLLATRSMWK
ncbi:BTB/POZ domain-containing protein 6-like [Daphnia magna]|nr:BTB/POZ domain-containing protein 6-like [Daphnia magna]